MRHERRYPRKSHGAVFYNKGVGKGTGLGLSMVHGLTAQCGGAMHISSQLGKGTVVTLWLPRASAEDAVKAPEQPLVHAQDAVSRKLSILLVDDDALVSMGTANMLIDLGHNVVKSHSAKHALQLLARTHGSTSWSPTTPCPE